MVAASGTDDALADDAVAPSEPGYVGADLHNLAGPLVAGSDRILESDDVPAIEQLEIGVTNPDSVRADQDVIRSDGWNRNVANGSLIRSVVDERLHGCLHFGLRGLP